MKPFLLLGLWILLLKNVFYEIYRLIQARQKVRHRLIISDVVQD